MTFGEDPVTQHFYQRAIAARTEAERAQLLREIDARMPHEREHWEALLADAAQLRTGVADVAVPHDLAARLMNIPGPTAPQPWWNRVGQVQAKWWHGAIVAAAAAAIVFYLQMPAPIPPALPSLDSTVAGRVATLAVLSHVVPPTTSGPAKTLDPAAVLAAWQNASLPFTPQLLNPCEPMDLTAAGVTKLGDAPASYAQWHSGPTTYTLYQFDGHALGLPKEFRVTPSDHHPDHTSVEIWPGAGGECGWVLVAENPTRSNPFVGNY